jgi:hypothetical protein
MHFLACATPSRFRSGADLPTPSTLIRLAPGCPTPGCTPSMRPHVTPTRWYRNVNLLSIIYALRPRLRLDSPDADWPCVGNLRLTANVVLTHFSLLMPASSLPECPASLTALTFIHSATLPYHKSLASVTRLAPCRFPRRCVRPVSYYALFKG